MDNRRAIAIRHARFNAALITSALVNAHRSAESDPVSPFDFLAGFETVPDEAEKLRKSIKHAIALAFTEMRGASKEAVLAERAAMVARMTENGVLNADELIREVFPDMGS